MTKRQQAIYEAYERSDLYDLYDAYAIPSGAKRLAWWQVVEGMRQRNGGGLKIIGFNTFMFSIGYTFKDDSGRDIFHYETAQSVNEWAL